MNITTIAQLVTAGGTVFYVVVFGTLYFLLLRLYRQTLREMREEHAPTERPQVLVGADYGRLPEVDLVVKNIGRGRPRTSPSSSAQ
jgi:hypothetical protein